MGKRGYIAILIVLSLLLASCSLLTKAPSKAPSTPLGTEAPEEVVPEETAPMEEEYMPNVVEATLDPPIPVRRGGAGGGGGGGAAGGGGGGGGGGGTVGETTPAVPEEPVAPATTSDAFICTNAQNGNLCSGLDVAYGEGYASLCCTEHGACC